MLTEIIHTKDFDFTGYIELERVVKKIGKDGLNEIVNILDNLFDTSLYTDQIGALKTIDLTPSGFGASKYIHGIYHVEKVFLYCYLMAKMNDSMPDEFKTILFYAALYHDIGRVDNSESKDHGFNSAKIFYNKFKDLPFFKEDKRRLYLVEFLMTMHSQDELTPKTTNNLLGDVLWEHDEDYKNVDYIKDYAGEYFKPLCDILKDADALDRKRFGEWQRASLDEDYLRTTYSKQLVKFADEINKLYYEMMKSRFVEPDVSSFKHGDCFHSIGFDFFKIRSILTYGILSQDEMKIRRIKVPRNFPGGNFDRWISVVDASFYPAYVNQEKLLELLYIKYPNLKDSPFSEVKEYYEQVYGNKFHSYAAGMFTHNGITFYLQDIPFRTPEDDREKALEDGLPWNKSGYVDEKYVYQKITPSNIHHIFIPIECINSDIKKLWYVFESTNMDIIRARVEYYLNYTEAPKTGDKIVKLNDLLDAYEKLIIKELKKSGPAANSTEYFDESNRIMTEINKIIGEFIFDYYKRIFNSQVFGIKDIVEYEIKNTLGMDYEIVNEAELDSKELLFTITRTAEKEKGKVI